MKTNKFLLTHPNVFLLTFIGVFFLTTSLSGQNLSLKSKNTLAKTTIVYTYSIDNTAPTYKADSITTPSSQSIQNYVHFFLSFKGIAKATFDETTGLVTVVGNTSTNLPSLIKSSQVKQPVLDDGSTEYIYNNETNNEPEDINNKP